MAEAEGAAMASEEGVPPQRLLVLGGTGSTGKWFVGHALNHGYICFPLLRTMRASHARLPVCLCHDGTMTEDCHLYI